MIGVLIVTAKLVRASHSDPPESRSFATQYDESLPVDSELDLPLSTYDTSWIKPQSLDSQFTVKEGHHLNSDTHASYLDQLSPNDNLNSALNYNPLSSPSLSAIDPQLPPSSYDNDPTSPFYSPYSYAPSYHADPSLNPLLYPDPLTSPLSSNAMTSLPYTAAPRPMRASSAALDTFANTLNSLNSHANKMGAQLGQQFNQNVASVNLSQLSTLKRRSGLLMTPLDPSPLIRLAGVSSLITGVSQRRIFNPLNRIILSIIGPRLMKFQLDMMVQAIISELVKKLLLPVVGIITGQSPPTRPDALSPTAQPTLPPDVMLLHQQMLQQQQAAKQPPSAIATTPLTTTAAPVAAPNLLYQPATNLPDPTNVLPVDKQLHLQQQLQNLLQEQLQTQIKQQLQQQLTANPQQTTFTFQVPAPYNQLIASHHKLVLDPTTGTAQIISSGANGLSTTAQLNTNVFGNMLSVSAEPAASPPNSHSLQPLHGLQSQSYSPQFTQMIAQQNANNQAPQLMLQMPTSGANGATTFTLQPTSNAYLSPSRATKPPTTVTLTANGYLNGAQQTTNWTSAATAMESPQANQPQLLLIQQPQEVTNGGGYILMPQSMAPSSTHDQNEEQESDDQNSLKAPAVNYETEANKVETSDSDSNSEAGEGETNVMYGRPSEAGRSEGQGQSQGQRQGARQGHQSNQMEESASSMNEVDQQIDRARRWNSVLRSMQRTYTLKKQSSTM
jgi:hypothetical protein